MYWLSFRDQRCPKTFRGIEPSFRIFLSDVVSPHTWVRHRRDPFVVVQQTSFEYCVNNLISSYFQSFYFLFLPYESEQKGERSDSSTDEWKVVLPRGNLQISKSTLLTKLICVPKERCAAEHWKQQKAPMAMFAPSTGNLMSAAHVGFLLRQSQHAWLSGFAIRTRSRLRRFVCSGILDDPPFNFLRLLVETLTLKHGLVLSSKCGEVVSFFAILGAS